MTKIEANSIPEPNTGCWLWLGGQGASGYGMYSIGAKGKGLAHRLAYETYIGRIPRGMMVRHTCDQPMCVNPDHLIIGTHQDNMEDKTRRGRCAGAKGEAHWKASLTAEQVIAIRADTRKQSDIARDYGIRQQAVSKIKRGETWQHVSAA